ncbi:MAG: ATP-binding protein [Anaerolineales bacterium]
MDSVKPLSTIDLYRHCDLDQLPFDTTDDLEDINETIGQPRAVEAVRFGIGIQQDGYNIYAMGSSGMGKRSLVMRFFEEQAKQQPTPNDWCYVYNFERPHQPHAISLPSGRGTEFQKDMERFVGELRSTLSAAFESDDYRARRQVIEQEAQESQEKSLEQLQQQAQEQSIAMVRTPNGLVFAPMRNGEVLSPEEFRNLPQEEREKMEADLESFQRELQKILQQVPVIQREIRDHIHELNQEVTRYSVSGLITELKETYADIPVIVEYLDEVQEDLVENAHNLLSEDSSDNLPQGLAAAMAARTQMQQQAFLHRYQVNLIVDHHASEGAPVVYEDNPTMQNILGRVEHMAQMGALFTDFTLIKPGALHAANGGFLVLDVRKVLQQPYTWEAMKRTLQAKQIRIESVEQMFSLISTVSLEPEPFPLNVKIAFLGERNLYYLLSSLDPDFNELFKVLADFDEQMERDNDSQVQYARVIARMVREDHLLPFNRRAVARVIEHSARLVEDSQKLYTGFRDIANLLREASYWSGQNGNEVVTSKDVQKAVDMQIYRSDRLRERIQETILRDIYLIDTQGAKVGQVNGLSVIQLGGFSFGRPSRITASVRLGKGDLVNIEREVDLSGPIHSKGVLILSGLLGDRYTRERPLSLSASLVFEQSYGEVDGDSASSAELYVLLSAIAGIPIKQSLAVTGSINQHGEVQAIGGANEKIEGFFEICRARGLTGDQGVLIPASNVENLMLRQDVIDAVEAGEFSIFPVRNIDQGMEILTGIPAGEPDDEGHYSADTVNGRVMARLQEFAEKVQEFSRQNLPPTIDGQIREEASNA